MRPLEVRIIQAPDAPQLSETERARITAVIAAMNEEQCIGLILDETAPHVGQILVVDGHSKDRTAEIAASKGAQVVLDNRKGKGDALRTAIPNIKTEFVVFLDADGSHDPSDIPRVVRPLLDGTCDHVTGSRLIGGSSELHGGFDECFRLMGSSFITACINWRFKVRLSDSQNGFRAFRTEILPKLGLREDITTIEQEMIMKTLHAGYRLGEVPTHEYARRAGVSHISLRRVWWRYGYTLVRYLIAP
jgi:glycosyltransferase involved in cell wall biosynthesis